VIDSRSKSTKAAAVKTTKHGTPPPTRPAPPPPARSIKEGGKGSPKSQNNSPVPKPRTLLPRSRDVGSHNQDSSSARKSQKDVVTNEPVIDQTFPIYEDLDKDDNNYEKLDPSSSSDDDENEPTLTNFNSDATPPPLPPKKGGGAKKELRHKKEEESPPLPPRTLPATTIRKHRLLADPNRVPDGNIIVDKRKDSEEEENDEALQDTGVYEPVIYRDSDDESQKSQG
jgi:hypothetical protein